MKLLLLLLLLLLLMRVKLTVDEWCHRVVVATVVTVRVVDHMLESERCRHEMVMLIVVLLLLLLIVILVMVEIRLL